MRKRRNFLFGGLPHDHGSLHRMWGKPYRQDSIREDAFEPAPSLIPLDKTLVMARSLKIDKYRIV
jgi:hypothetical protein